MNAPIKFSTQKGEGGTVGYSVMTLLLLYRLLIRALLKISRFSKNSKNLKRNSRISKKKKKSFWINLFALLSILAQRSKGHNLVGAYESRAKHTRLGVKVV